MTFPQVSQTYKDPYNYPEGIAFQEGQYLLMKDAKVSVLDWGFLHSDATYDTVHVWDGAFFRLDLHLDRFFAGLEKLHMSIPFDRSQVADILANCVALSGHRNAYVEMICTRGGSPSFSRDPRDAANRFIAFAVPYGSVANAAQMERGLRIAISDVVRIPPKSVDPSIKNYHWLDLVRGLYDAFDRDAETALLLDTDGNIAEGPGFNVFAVKGGSLRTPQFGVLPGITRRTVFDLCTMLDIDVGVGNVSPDALKTADEVFITSTAGGIMPVSSVDETRIGNGRPGPVTGKIKALYWDMHKDPTWSTVVAFPEDVRGASSRPM
ncbi:aminotransferase class IV [Roseibium marinum]|uniref:Probable branched-chain-amino-acid aminotransferase n=1 Tax=Roseibium marinum TaxID=281252 RepID=A0A2S3UWM3_9HYPH|nr:aminotransferase class IV [Roseibium marinum]POF32121.1 branched-chain amino acid aminotransferase [Roseibium marinum]